MTAKHSPVDEQDLRRIKDIVGSERMSTGESVLHLHRRDESFHKGREPEVVVWPINAAEISKVLDLANERSIPVTAWGAGSSLEGNPIPVERGIVLDLQRMNHILELREQDLQVRVEAGVVYKELNQHLSRFGLFFPPDPGASATIGGMVGNNASGIRSVKYGSTKDFILNMVVVLPSGDVIRVGTNALKSSSGYDLCRLFVGSEGTLGVMTEATLRLVGLPGEFMATIVQFETLRAATDAVSQIVRSGLTPAALELLDAATVGLVGRHKHLSLEERPTLFIEFQGTSAASLKEDLEYLREICEEYGPRRFESGIGREERNRIWDARYGIRETIKATHPGLSALVMDTAVPLSRFSEMVEAGRRILETNGLEGYAFGHAGSGNVHIEILGHPEDETEWRAVEETADKIVRFALSCGGTATGEHGVGIGKRKFMQEEHGESLKLMKQIKDLLDPHGIMNPGKIFG
jgi:D-lactate dehydrogenase (cytochrome)